MSFSQKSKPLSGFILIDKPVGCTSTTIVRKIKKIFNIKRVGHLGTLDPFATGLLPIMIEGSTRLSEDLMDTDKQYLFTIQLGIETDTLDSTGQIINRASVPQNITFDSIREILNDSFLGLIEQTPPVYSAIKMDGRPLYEYMRATGKLPYDIKTKTRNVNINNIELLNFNPDLSTIEIRVSCTKGTYIRSLARDIAQKLGTLGICSTLRRERIGNFLVQNAFKLEDDMNAETTGIKNILLSYLLSPQELLPNLPSLFFTGLCAKRLLTGNVLTINKIENSDEFALLSEYLLTPHVDPKIFASVLNQDSPLFIAFIQFLDKDTIKIKPQKKLF